MPDARCRVTDRLQVNEHFRIANRPWDIAQQVKEPEGVIRAEETVRDRLDTTSCAPSAVANLYKHASHLIEAAVGGLAKTSVSDRVFGLSRCLRLVVRRLFVAVAWLVRVQG